MPVIGVLRHHEQLLKVPSGLASNYTASGLTVVVARLMTQDNILHGFPHKSQLHFTVFVLRSHCICNLPLHIYPQYFIISLSLWRGLGSALPIFGIHKGEAAHHLLLIEMLRQEISWIVLPLHLEEG
jgi:hypothetical protein